MKQSSAKNSDKGKGRSFSRPSGKTGAWKSGFNKTKASIKAKSNKNKLKKNLTKNKTQISTRHPNVILMQRIRGLFMLQLILVFSVVVHFLDKEQWVDDLIAKEWEEGTIREKKEFVPDEHLRAEIKEIVDEIHHLNRKFFLGVEEVVVATEDLRVHQHNSKFCGKGHVLGAYNGNKIIIKDSGKELNKHTIFHEVGHNIWTQMNAQQKEEWIDLYKNTDSFVTPYSQVNENENFAENFACYYTNYKGCKERMLEKKVSFIAKVV